MGGNEELFGLEQSRGWTKLQERLKIEHDKCRASQDGATKQGRLDQANYHLGWVDCIKWMSRLQSQMVKSLPMETHNG